MSHANAAPPLRLVLVEDSDGYAALVCTLLSAEQAPPTVTRFARLDDALRHLAHTPVDCLLLDLALPDAEGPEMLERVRAVAPDVPVVVLTGRDDDGLGVQLIRAGAQDYLVKGSEAGGALMRAVRHAVERRRTGEREEVARLVRAVASEVSGLAVERDQQRTSRRFLLAGLAGVLAVLALQLAIGGVSLFYVFPIGIVSANAGRRVGLGIASLAVLVAALTAHLGVGPLVAHAVTFLGVALVARRSREQADRTAHLLRSVVDGTTDAIFVRDLSGRYVMANSALARHLGRSRDELIGRTPEEVAGPQAGAAWSSSDHAVIASGETRQYVRTVPIDGIDRTHSTVKSPLRDASGRIVGVIGVSRDETEVRRLQAETARFFDLAPDMLCTASHDGRLERLNQAWSATLGWSPDELRSRPLVEFVHPADRPRAERELSDLLAGRIERCGNRLATKSGGWREIEWTARVAPEDGRVYAAARDVTERVAMERALADGEERYRALVEILPGSSVVRFDHDLRFTFAAGEAISSAGLDGIVVGRSVREVFGERAAELTPRYRAALGGHAQSFEFAGRDGRLYWVRVVPLRDRDGAVSGGMLLSQDVTELKHAERGRAEAEERFRTAFDQAPIGMALVSLDDSLLRVNAALCAITGRSPEELLGADLSAIVHPGDRAAEHAARSSLLAEGGVREGEFRWQRPDGDVVWVSTHAALVREADGRPSHVLVQVQDVTERRRFEAQLRHQADHDPLTGLINRRRFEAELERHAEEAARYGPQGALLLVDLDRFKEVNDRLGHAAGDAALRRVADVLQSALRASDLISRLGGDEFAVLLARGTVEDAEEVAARLVEAIREDPEAGVTASIGVCGFEDPSAGGPRVLAAADRAMYAAKELGRDAWARERPPLATR